MDALRGLFDWFVDGAPGAATPQAVVEGMCAELVAGGLPIARVAVFVTTLHPQVLGRGFFWRPGAPVGVFELTLAHSRAEMRRKSPLGEVYRTGREFRRRLADEGAGEYEVLGDFVAEGMTDYVALPLVFLTGQVHVISFATSAPAGFEEGHLAALRRVLRPLARLTEIFALRRVATNLLDTYVGRKCGERILAGRIFKGDIEAIQAVLWFSDLRGFTEVAARQTARETIDMLGELFECQVPAIEARGGEVLKFIGDGLLAIFPFAGEAGAACEAALAATELAFAALARRNEVAAAPIRFGLALHVGEVAYGNIGGGSRLDFTAIGSAVNLAARLEGLTARLGRALVVSEEFAASAARPFELLGEFELKGVAGPRRVFAPPR